MNAGTSLRAEQELIADWISSGSRVLDLGCGDGALLAALRAQKGVTGYGIEIDPDNIVTFPNMGHWKCRAQFALGRMPVTRHLPNTWFDTPNIHMCTIEDFEDLCARDNIEVLQRANVDSQHRAVIGMRLLPNLLAEIAVYRFRRRRTAGDVSRKSPSSHA